MPVSGVSGRRKTDDKSMDIPFDWWPDPNDPACRLVVAFLCGLILGIEREARDKAAGLRTIILISVGSALYLMVGESASAGQMEMGRNSQPDPTRIGSEVVSGIGFLGAGSIIQSRGAVHGLTTAATIWVAAAVGLCAGLGLYAIALSTTVFVVLALVLLDPLADRFRSLLHRQAETWSFLSAHDSLTVTRVELILREHGVKSDALERSVTADGSLLWDVRVRLRSADQLRLVEALAQVRAVQGIDSSLPV